MAWIFLLFAGLLEVGWAAGLKSVSAKASLFGMGVTAALMIASLVALALAMRSLPLGVAYPIWTGIGSVGAVTVGVIFYKDSLDLMTVLGVIFLCLGMFLIGGKTH